MKYFVVICELLKHGDSKLTLLQQNCGRS